LTRLLIDTSVLIKWFHSAGEPELNESRALRAAHLSGDLDAHIVELAVYEVGNLLVRSLKWPADEVADQLDDLLAIFGTPLVLTPQWLRDASSLATEHNLSFYDAGWAATARGLDVPLISADAKLISAGLAESPTQIVQRLRLSMH
jgi:predicted nucleic acid-binding protein